MRGKKEDRDSAVEDSIIARSGRPTRMEEATLPRGHPENPFASDWRYVPVPDARTKREITRPRVLGRIRKCTRVRLTTQRSSFSKAYISIKGQLTWMFVGMVAETSKPRTGEQCATLIIDVFEAIDLSLDFVRVDPISPPFDGATRRKGGQGQPCLRRSPRDLTFLFNCACLFTIEVIYR